MTSDAAAALGDMRQLLGGGEGAVPFLPAGKGALILVLGGFVMLGLALLAALFAPRPTSLPVPLRRNLIRQTAPVSFMSATPPAQPQGLVRAGANAPNGWAWAFERAAEQLPMGQGHVVDADGARCVYVLDRCASCVRHTRGRHGCERERNALQRAIQRLEPRALVSETACDVNGRATCTFEIRRNATA